MKPKLKLRGIILLKMRSKNLAFIGILSLVLALVWAGVTAISKMREKTTPADLEKIMTPIDPRLDMEFFSVLEGREKWRKSPP